MEKSRLEAMLARVGTQANLSTSNYGDNAEVL